MKKTNGTITRLEGGIVEIFFEGVMPPLHSLLVSKNAHVFLEPIEQKDWKTLRAIGLSPLEGLARGEEFEMLNPQIPSPISDEILGRMFDVFGKPVDNKPWNGTGE